VINRRSDQYGGSTKKRAKFPIEVFLVHMMKCRATRQIVYRSHLFLLQSIRAALGDDFPIVVKMNADDGFPFNLPGGLKVQEAVQIAELFAEAGVDAIIPSFGYTSLNGFGMLRGNVPLSKMVEALPGAGTKWLAKNLGTVLVPEIEYESLFLEDTTKLFIGAIAEKFSGRNGNGNRDSCVVIYIGGADSYASIEKVLSQGCAAVQLGRPLLRGGVQH
jgi:2,4-dienoyl-CoA reductase-like NADH-dependent reductase (Old Yellow Enzyme family)